MHCIVCEKPLKKVTEITVQGTDNNTYPIEFCACGLGKTIFTHKYSQAEVNEEHYNNIEPRIKIYYYSLSHHMQVRYNESLRVIQQYTKGKKLIEIGSNIGYTLSLARKQGFDVKGCELNENAASFCRLVYDIEVLGDIFQLQDKYDIIIMNDVLEHFPNPLEAVIKVKEILNDNGVCFVQLPNNVAGLSAKNIEQWTYWLPPDHTYHFSVPSLEKLFVNNGLKMLWSRTVNGIEDKKPVQWLPETLRQKFLYFMHHNQFYWPGFYPARSGKGAFIQAIFTK